MSGYFARADDATIKLAKMPIEPLAEILVAIGQHLKDVEMICLVVGLLTVFSGEDLCF